MLQTLIRTLPHTPRLLRTRTWNALLAVALVLGLAAASAVQAQSVQLRLNILENEKTVGGTFRVAIEVKQTAISPSTFGSGTVDLEYDEDHLTNATPVSSDFKSVEGYGYQLNGSGGTPEDRFARFGITGNNVGPGLGEAGHDVFGDYLTYGEWTFEITQAGVDAAVTDLYIKTGSVSIGFFEDQSNEDGNGIIYEADISMIDNGYDTALPVELSRFEAAASGQEAIRLTWQTASETGNARFDVQRQAVATHDLASARDASAEATWQTIGREVGAGTTTEAQSYAFTDADVPFEAGAVQYRLKQVDLDGTTTYSEAVEVAVAQPEQFTLHGVFPNPFRQATTIRYELPEARHVAVEVYDVLGRQVATLVDGRQEAGRKQIRFDASGLSAGIYVYRLQAGDYVEARRMVRIR